VNLITLDWVRRRKDKEITAPLYTKLRFVRGQVAFVFFSHVPFIDPSLPQPEMHLRDPTKYHGVSNCFSDLVHVDIRKSSVHWASNFFYEA
jgi:hypothetical protein